MREDNDNEKKEKRRRLMLLLLLLLLIGTATTEVLLLRRIGNLENAATGRMEDTIILSPQQSAGETVTEKETSGTDAKATESEAAAYPSGEQPTRAASGTEEGDFSSDRQDENAVSGKETDTPGKQQESTEKSSAGSTGSSGGSGGGGRKDEPSDPTPEDGFSIYDEAGGTKWSQATDIDLFSGCSRLYPGVTGSYQFRVQNGVKGSLTFRMTLAEKDQGEEAIPLEYRLKDDNGYVTGSEWLSAEELSAVNVGFDRNGSTSYTLEWRWPRERGNTPEEIAENDRRDTQLGAGEGLIHEVTVTLHAETCN